MPKLFSCKTNQETNREKKTLLFSDEFKNL